MSFHRSAGLHRLYTFDPIHSRRTRWGTQGVRHPTKLPPIFQTGCDRHRALNSSQEGCMAVDTSDPILSEPEYRAWVGISAPTAQRQRSDGSGPPFIQLSRRRIGYRKSAVERW